MRRAAKIKEEKRRPALVVSIHDVTPYFFPQLKQIGDRLQEVGIKAMALKVIPNYRGEVNILSSEPFLNWLRQLKDKGSEIVLHGFEHLRPNPSLHSLLRRRPSFLTKGEDEFAAITSEEARQRLLLGGNILAAANLDYAGFTAPTWRVNRQTIQALKESGFSYLTTFSGLTDLRTGKRYFSPACGHQGIEPWLETMMSWGNRLAEIFLFRCLPLIRIVFHPTGLDQPNFARSIRLVRRLLPRVQVTTYARFLSGK